ncbi:EAL domain-containing protein [Burkholderia diffusa]|uniref:EAL domain-containing protein n=1 Tax=Burkholderia diffusa TaxID=488732 RepID=UPI0018C8D464|nr:EAL domain-containing protein [Burkholderia diffusa]
MAHDLSDELLRWAQQVCGESFITVRAEDDGIVIRLDGGQNDLRERRICSDSDHLELLLVSLKQPQVCFPQLTRLAIVEARYQDGAFNCLWGLPSAVHVPASAVFAALELASDIVDTMYDGSLVFSFQPIRAVVGKQRECYRECMVQVPHLSFGLLAPPSYVPSLERAGRECEFDSFVVLRMIDQLIADPTIELGYNISARSAMPNPHWDATFEALVDYPDVASRVVIEIDEGALVKSGQARSFAYQLRRLGCRLAIKRFGVRYGALTAAEFPTPDVIKIDPLLLWQAGDSARAASRLASMVSLARDIAADVVVDGVMSGAQFELAMTSGATWAQGPWLASPAALWPDHHFGRREGQYA